MTLSWGAGALFVGAVLLVAVVSLLWASKGRVRRYSRTPEGRNALPGIGMFVGIGVVVVLLFSLWPGKSSADRVQWGAWGELYLGLDVTDGQSPQCEDNGPSARLTSNGGFRANVLQVDGGRFQVNGKYTHHSCAFNVDRNLYDAVGLELVYRLW